MVVDTNRPDMVENRQLLDACNRVAVIDHHRRAASYIENAAFSFHEPYASSASELVKVRPPVRRTKCFVSSTMPASRASASSRRRLDGSMRYCSSSVTSSGRAKATEKRTKVKSRVMANALRELLADSQDIYVMGHSFADMDAVGAAVGPLGFDEQAVSHGGPAAELFVNLGQDGAALGVGAGVHQLLIVGEQNLVATTYWVDTTEMDRLREDFDATRLVVGIVMVDNYEDLGSSRCSK